MASRKTIASLFLTGIVALRVIACTSSKDPTPNPTPTPTSTAAGTGDGGAHSDAGPVAKEPPSGW